MFREMRRKKQALSLAECARILYRGTSGVLALSGDGGYPYAVPMSYVYDGEKLFFHSAGGDGHKLDAIRRGSRRRPFASSTATVWCRRHIPGIFPKRNRIRNSSRSDGQTRKVRSHRQAGAQVCAGRRRRASPERHRPRVEKPVLAGADAGASLRGKPPSSF